MRSARIYDRHGVKLGMKLPVEKKPKRGASVLGLGGRSQDGGSNRSRFLTSTYCAAATSLHLVWDGSKNYAENIGCQI